MTSVCQSIDFHGLCPAFRCFTNAVTESYAMNASTPEFGLCGYDSIAPASLTSLAARFGADRLSKIQRNVECL